MYVKTIFWFLKFLFIEVKIYEKKIQVKILTKKKLAPILIFFLGKFQKFSNKFMALS